MAPGTILIVMILSLAVLFNAWSAIPILAFVWKPVPLQNWIGRLKGIGFSYLGIKVEHLPLWGAAYREAALVSREAEAYASIVLKKDGTPSTMYFYTPFRNGGMVFTRSHLYGTEMETESISMKNVPYPDFRDILDNHTARVRAFQNRGLISNVGSSPQSRIDATMDFYRSEYSRKHGKYLFLPGVVGFFTSLAGLGAVLVWYFRHSGGIR
jgi:hypothetical protein